MAIDFNIDLSQIQNLDPENIGSWPRSIKIGITILVCAAALGLGYYFDTQSMQKNLKTVMVEEESLIKQFRDGQNKAVNLDGYLLQMQEMEESFGTMLRQLPSRNEVADLLVDITQTGLANGLDFELFEPGSELHKEFYAELPIQLKLVGTYHQFSSFVSGLAALPRIVTLEGISISRNGKGGDELLIITALAKTYRYLDDDEKAAGRRR